MRSGPIAGAVGLLGDTPLIRLDRLGALRPGGPSMFAKWEAANLTGSAKDRPAAQMIEAALADGVLRPGGTVVESSSGNLGVALAALCRWHGLRFICVLDPRTNASTAQLISVYGGELDRVTEPDPETGDWLVARRARVAQLLRTVPGAWCPDQYSNTLNRRAHSEGTMREIAADLDDDVAAVFVATSTTGTVGGCRDYVERNGLGSQVVAVDAEGSVLFGGARGRRVLPGFGAGLEPDLSFDARPSSVVRVGAADAVAGCRVLAQTEVLLAGASGGAVVAAALRGAAGFGPRDNIVLVLHDSGTRYLDTVYDDNWVDAEIGLDAVRHQHAELLDRPGGPES